MLISGSFKRKLVATCGAIIGFALLYEATVFDSRRAEELAAKREATARPAPGQRLRFKATAYCKGQTTAAGTSVQRGVAAADPTLLPVGSVINIDSLGPRYNGIYTVMDTGPAVTGREVDLYMWSCNEALAFGRRSVQLTVLRLGWHPGASSPSGVGSLFRIRERNRSSEAPNPGPAQSPETVPPASMPAPEAGASRPEAAVTPPGEANH